MFRPTPTEDLAAIVHKGRSRPLRKVIITLSGIALIGAGGWYFLQSRKPVEAVTEYITETAHLGEISLIVSAAGNLAPTNQVVIGSELSGTIDEVFVDTNDLVKKDQPLARLDTIKLDQQTERARASLLAAKARVSQAKATLEEAKAALARQEELHTLSEGRTPSRATMETSRASVSRAAADLESAQAAVAGAEAEVRAIERDREIAVIRSPVDGVVLTRTADVGQTVAASFTAPTLFTIAEDLRKMQLLVSITEADIGRVVEGQTATFSVDAWPRREYTATVKKVAFGSNNNQGAGGSNNNASSSGIVTYSAELEVDNEDLSLRPGMTATVDISIIEKNDILVVPNAALRFDPEAAAAIGKPDDEKQTLVQTLSSGGSRRRWRRGGSSGGGSPASSPRVFILQNGEPVEIPVTPGITDGSVTEIIDGELASDTPVIVNIKPAPVK